MSSTTVTNLQILQPPAVTKRNSNGSPKARKPPKDSSKGRSNARRNNGPVEAPNRTSVDEQLTFKVEKELVEKPVVTSLACVKGQPTIRRAGEYILGPEVGNSPIKTITSYLARKDQTDDFYIIRMLTLKASNEKDTIYDIQGKSLLHTEHSLSSLLSQETGIVHQHGMFRCKVNEIRVNENGEMRTEQLWKLCLVLDCYMPHDFSPKYSNIISMHHYVIKQKRLPEAEAIRIFYKVVEILDRLHKRNVVHRDIKPGSIILNRETGEVTLANFCLGQHVTGDNDLLVDRRGSPAHVSPDIVNGKPYLAKPSDLWSMGITLFIMLYGRFPFYDKDQAALFAKIRKGEFTIPKDVNVSMKTMGVINSLLDLDPLKRPTASQLLNDVRAIILAEESLMSDFDLQVVPTNQSWVNAPEKRAYTNLDHSGSGKHYVSENLSVHKDQ